MLAESFLEQFELGEYAQWIAVGAGVVVFLVVLLVNWLISGRRKNRAKQVAAVSEERDPFVHGGSSERRSALRRGGNPVAILISDAETRAKPSPGWVIDRSTGGLCLSVSEPVVEGTILSVRTSNAPETIPWVQLEVKNCRLVGREYELGCQFVRTPPWSVLLLFG
jgi:hypothetical protein